MACHRIGSHLGSAVTQGIGSRIESRRKLISIRNSIRKELMQAKSRLNATLLNRRFAGLPLAECLVLLTFTAIAAVAVCFHEPWADEAQAWLIARDLGIGGILHQMGYEGSPPLWHLLLWVLIRLHLPYAALGAVSLTLVAAGMYIWLRWSPLPALRPLAGSIRFLLPVSVRGGSSKLRLVDLAGVCGGCALESEAGSRDSPRVGCCIARTNQPVRIHDRGRNRLRVCLGIHRRVPQTASFANPTLADLRSRCSCPGFGGHCPLSGQAISRLQFQGGDPTAKGNCVGEHRAWTERPSRIQHRARPESYLGTKPAAHRHHLGDCHQETFFRTAVDRYFAPGIPDEYRTRWRSSESVPAWFC